MIHFAGGIPCNMFSSFFDLSDPVVKINDAFERKKLGQPLGLFVLMIE